jgi:hypothetical protein
MLYLRDRLGLIAIFTIMITSQPAPSELVASGSGRASRSNKVT